MTFARRRIVRALERYELIAISGLNQDAPYVRSARRFASRGCGSTAGPIVVSAADAGMKKHAISAFADAPAEKIVLVANANAAVGGFDEDVCRKERPRELTDRGNADRDAAESDAIDRNGLRFAEGGINRSKRYPDPSRRPPSGASRPANSTVRRRCPQLDRPQASRAAAPARLREGPCRRRT